MQRADQQVTSGATLRPARRMIFPSASLAWEVPPPAVRMVAAPSGASGGGAGGGSKRQRNYLTDTELQDLEARYVDGITAQQIVDAFVSRGIRFSEASFRKYVQQGLLSRSRRVGRKGKHRGSLGLYPANTIRRINSIKRLMDEGHTIEVIQAQVIRFSDRAEEALTSVEQWLSGMRDAVAELPPKQRKALQAELSTRESVLRGALESIEELSRRLGRRDAYAGGAAGSAEDLL